MLRHMRGLNDGGRKLLAGLLVIAIGLTAAPFVLGAEEAESKPPQPRSGEDGIRKALEETTEMEFIETPLTDVVDFLKTRHHVEIQFDTRSLNIANIAVDTPITKHLKGITLRSALRLLLRDLDLRYQIQDEVLMITARDVADSTLNTKVIPVRDLLSKAIQADGGKSEDYESLIEAMWIANPKAGEARVGDIKAVPSVAAIVVSQTQETHEKIEELLAALRKAREQFKD